MNVPKLRFKEFDGEWEQIKLGEIVSKMGSGSTPLGGEKAYSNKGIPFIRSQNVNNNKLILDDVVFISDIINNKMKGSIVKSNDILLNITGASLGRSCVVPENFVIGNVNQHVCIMRLVADSPIFIQSYLSSYNGQKKILSSQVGSGREGLNLDSIKAFKLFIPNTKEQTKIANFLTAIDERINQLTRKKELMTQYKQGVMQQIFSQKLRFKDDNGEDFADWEEKSLGGIAERVTRKNKENHSNVLTISAQFGLINQQEFFNKSVSAKDVTNYYLLHKDDFAYNKSYSNGYPMGAIKRLTRYDKGVVSTLYICFRFNQSINLYFMENYFDYGVQNKELEMVAQEGARNHGLLNIALDDFFGIRLILPSLEEQTKIANFLSVLDEKIQQISQQIDATKQYKQGLLQQMFV